VALYRSEVIVLRVQPFAEADRLATLLSPERGKVRAIAKGAQRGRGTLGATVQPFVRARLVLWEGRQLDGISQAELVNAHRRLSQDVGLMAAGSYCCDLADAFTAERQEARSAFVRLAQALGLLDADPAVAPAPAIVLRWFELQVLREAGFLPELEACTGCGAAIGVPDGRTRLSAGGGGVLCAECAPSAPDALWVSRNALRGLRYVAQAAAATLSGVRVGPATMTEMDAALARHIEAILQRPLRSRALLDTLT
jgi:DNA repair protein RecO (recombination protein O)